MTDYPLLGQINSPENLTNLSVDQIHQLTGEIRSFLIEKVCATGGHLGSNLGVVELTLALHRVFRSPHDAIVFDTGHQAYVHKILTGRRDQFDTLRQEGGLSGYPSRSESIHDLVESSHASSSLSYADGISRAFETQEQDRVVVVVIGDGALTGGMVWEALNNIASRPNAKIVIIVNDNGRSYSHTIGGFAKHLTYLRARPHYEKALRTSKSIIESVPLIGKGLYAILHAVKVGIKDILSPQRMFSDLNIKYLGPVDGHDFSALERVFTHARQFHAPTIVHCVTHKGRGFKPAEMHEEDLMHSTDKIDPVTGEALRSGVKKSKSWTEVFSEELIVLAQDRKDIVAITAAMPGPTGLLHFAQYFPDRMIDVGIAEQHALTCAAGLAMGGMHPVVAVYSTFLNRAFDQLVMDIGLHHLPVTLILDRAGITGSDGPSHNGMWDLSILSIVPGIRVAAPRDEFSLREALGQAVEISTGPSAIRFPKGSIKPSIEVISRCDEAIDTLYKTTITQRPCVLLIAIGPMAYECCDAAKLLVHKNIVVTVISPLWILPIPDSLIKMAADYDLVVSVEDNGTSGGFGSSLSNVLRSASIDVKHRQMSIAQEYLAHGTREAILSGQGLSAQGIAHQVFTWLQQCLP